MNDAGTAGLRTFFRIADRWKLTDEEQLGILGLRAQPQLEALRTDGS